MRADNNSNIVKYYLVTKYVTVAAASEALTASIT
jgi:hypothetical protein